MWLGGKGVLLEIHTYEQEVWVLFYSVLFRQFCSTFWVCRLIGIILRRQDGKEIKAMTHGKLPRVEMMQEYEYNHLQIPKRPLCGIRFVLYSHKGLNYMWKYKITFRLNIGKNFLIKLRVSCKCFENLYRDCKKKDFQVCIS